MDGAAHMRITGHDLDVLAPKLCALAAAKGWHLRELRVDRPTLEDRFVQITGQTP